MGRIAIAWKALHILALEHRADLGFSLRVTLAAVSSFTISYLLNVPLPLWTVLTAVVLTQVSFGRSVKATFDYIGGTLSGAVYAGAVAALIPHTNQAELTALLAITVAPLGLLAAIKPSFTAATFTGVLVLLVPTFTHVGPVASAVYRVLEVTVGGLTALTVSLLLPARAHSLAIEAAARMLDQAAEFVPELFAGFFSDRDAVGFARAHDRLGKAIARLDTVAAEARHERIGILAAGPELGPLRRTLLRLRHDLVVLGRAALPLPEGLLPRLGVPLARVAETVAACLRGGGEALAAGRDELPFEAASSALEDYARAFAAMRREGLTRGLPVDTVERIFVLGFALDQLRANLGDLERCVRENSRMRAGS
jgi:uncharacterized membrane protein YccC